VTNKPLEPVIVGADIGNATTAVATLPNGGSFLPSALTRLGVRPYDGMPVRGTSRHHIGYDKIQAIIGADALDLPGVDTLLSDSAVGAKRYTEQASLLCLFAGVSAALDGDVLGVRLATGMPLSLFEAHGAEVVKTLKGLHTYLYNGQQRRLLIADVKVYGEGREAWRLLSDEQRRGNVAIHDIGGRTWNVLLFRDGALRGARTYDFGIERMLDAIPAAPAGVSERWALQTEMRKSSKAHADIRAALESVITTEALATIERKIALGSAQRHAVLGGGAPFVAGVLRKRYGVDVVTLGGDAPETANARAYALALASEGNGNGK
jgi:hypothetical protein